MFMIVCWAIEARTELWRAVSGERRAGPSRRSCSYEQRNEKLPEVLCRSSVNRYRVKFGGGCWLAECPREM